MSTGEKINMTGVRLRGHGWVASCRVCQKQASWVASFAQACQWLVQHLDTQLHREEVETRDRIDRFARTLR